MKTKALDLGCGLQPQNLFKQDEAYGIDIRENTAPNVLSTDLAISPIPFPDNYFDRVTALDFIEHIPRVIYNPNIRFCFVELMNEIYRVLKPGGYFYSRTPAYPSQDAFTDPTHVNIITENTFPFYFDDTNRYAAMYGFNGYFNIEEQIWHENKIHLGTLMKKILPEVGKVTNNSETEVGVDWAWSTNRPLLKALVNEFNPGLIVEIGVGIYSTSCLNKQSAYIGIDNDEEWLNKVKNEIKFEGSSIFRFQDINGVSKGDKVEGVGLEVMSEIKAYYAKLNDEVSIRSEQIKMLFVDNYRACRTSAIDNAGPAFEIIAYHDCEPEGVEWYKYYFSKHIRENYNKYYLKTSKSWTGVFIAKNLSHNLSAAIGPFIDEYIAEVGQDVSASFIQVENNE